VFIIVFAVSLSGSTEPLRQFHIHENFADQL